jgi:hypothetical protein
MFLLRSEALCSWVLASATSTIYRLCGLDVHQCHIGRLQVRAGSELSIAFKIIDIKGDTPTLGERSGGSDNRIELCSTSLALISVVKDAEHPDCIVKALPRKNGGAL